MKRELMVSQVKPRLSDLAWAAAFLEGEGTFGYSGNRVTQVEATQLNPEPLLILQALLGGRIGPNRQYARWYVAGERARGIMLTLYLFMSQRRKLQIRNALNATKAKTHYLWQTKLNAEPEE